MNRLCCGAFMFARVAVNRLWQWHFGEGEHRHYYSDLHATILNQLGLDYRKMAYELFGRTFRLVEDGDGPIQEILA
jgi:hypothetical protein